MSSSDVLINKGNYVVNKRVDWVKRNSKLIGIKRGYYATHLSSSLFNDNGWCYQDAQDKNSIAFTKMNSRNYDRI